MLRGTHLDGGKVATNLVCLILVLYLKFSSFDYLTQVLVFVVAYPGIRYLAELFSLLPDCDQGLEQIPIRNAIGYLMSAYGRKIGASHRTVPMHCMESYSRVFIPTFLVAFIIALVTEQPMMVIASMLILSAYFGAMSHLILDGYNLAGVFITKNRRQTLTAVKNQTASFYLKWLFVIPIIYRQAIKIDVLEKKTGGTYELIIRNNVNLLNTLSFKLTLLILAIDFRLFWNTARIILL